jgi:glyoxylase-like metal-dependent hydrolase (beta-lactamase superfamily II)
MRRAGIGSALVRTGAGGMTQRSISHDSCAVVARDVFDSPSVHRLVLGATTVTVVSDGHAEIPAAFFAGGVGAARVHEILATDSVRVALNGLVLEHEGLLVVVDPGSGPADGPYAGGVVAATQGQFLANFRRAGFSVDDVDLVILTHGHHDHVGGALDPDGGLTFPKARVAMSAVEFRHWRDIADYGEGTVPEPLAVAARALGRALTDAVSDRVAWLDEGRDLLPGLRAVPAPGHTCGHTALTLETSDGTLLIGADFATHEIVQLVEPASHMVVDHDGAQAVASRRRLLRRAASERLLVHGFHFAWPGLGRIEPEHDRWLFTPLAR